MDINIPRIQEVQIFDAYTLIIKFTNDKRKSYDVTPLLNREMFAPLKSFAYFKNVHVEPGGYAIAWDANIDISEYELWKNGKEMP
ncbi:MAG: DUF2442 domain-containing protein [bacterium]